MEGIVISATVIIVILLAVALISLRWHALLQHRSFTSTLKSIHAIGDPVAERLLVEAHKDGLTTTISVEKIKTVAEESIVAPEIFAHALMSGERRWQLIGYQGLKLLDPHRAVALILESEEVNKDDRAYYRWCVGHLAWSVPVSGKAGIIDIVGRLLANRRSTYPWACSMNDQLDYLREVLDVAVRRRLDFTAADLTIETLLDNCLCYAKRMAAGRNVAVRRAGESLLAEIAKLQRDCSSHTPSPTLHADAEEYG